MNVRDLKLAIASGIETEEIKSLNKFFDDLFSDLKIYTDGDNPDLIFMKGDICFMEQDLKNAVLWCRYKDFWRVLEYQYHCTYEEIQGIIQYKVEEAFKMRSLIPKELGIKFD